MKQIMLKQAKIRQKIQFHWVKMSELNNIKGGFNCRLALPLNLTLKLSLPELLQRKMARAGLVKAAFVVGLCCFCARASSGRGKIAAGLLTFETIASQALHYQFA